MRKGNAFQRLQYRPDAFFCVLYIFFCPANTIGKDLQTKENDTVKATGIVRRIDDLGRVVIPKEIRRTMRIREGDPLLMTLTNEEIFILGVLKLGERMGIRCAE